MVVRRSDGRQYEVCEVRDLGVVDWCFAICRHGETQHPRASSAQGSHRIGRLIAELSGGGDHSLPSLLRQSAGSIDDVGDRGGRDLRLFSNLSQRGTPAASSQETQPLVINALITHCTAIAHGRVHDLQRDPEEDTNYVEGNRSS
jgi:hypothetical protein